MLYHSFHTVCLLILHCKCSVRALISKLVTLNSLLRVRPCCAFSGVSVSVEKNEGMQAALCKPTWEDRCVLKIKLLCLCLSYASAEGAALLCGLSAAAVFTALPCCVCLAGWMLGDKGKVDGSWTGLPVTRRILNETCK